MKSNTTHKEIWRKCTNQKEGVGRRRKQHRPRRESSTTPKKDANATPRKAAPPKWEEGESSTIHKEERESSSTKKTWELCGAGFRQYAVDHNRLLFDSVSRRQSVLGVDRVVPIVVRVLVS